MDTTNGEKETKMEPIHEIEHWNPIFCTSKRKKIDEPIHEEESGGPNDTNRWNEVEH